VARLLEEPEEIKVRCNADGMPVSVMRSAKFEKVESVYQRWRVSDEWWRKEISREYFRIETSSGLLCDIYRDIVTNRWFLSRFHD
jgi:hypothetical protein